jgi:3-hydroxybutyryl-CoA dehydrogenase
MPEPAIAVRRVAVIGAGTAGRAFALRCAGTGFDVVLEDVMPARLRRAQDEYGEYAESTEQANVRAGSLRYALTVEEAVHDADLAIDFVPDELESKLEIFSLLDRMAPPRTILCTPTRSLSITDLASCTYRPAQCVGLRRASADLLGGDVEIVRSRFLEPSVERAMGEFLGGLGIVSCVVEDREEPMLVKNFKLSV